MSSCPLCSFIAQSHVENQFRPEAKYWLCDRCDLIFLSPDLHLSAADEKNRYQLHQNSAEDLGYVQFLQPVIESIVRHFPRSQAEVSGLDFGCGPSPVLSKLLTQIGFEMRTFDPFFCSDLEALERRYDFVVSTEVFEHFYQPGLDIEKIVGLLERESSSLFILTQQHQGREHFRTWWYPRDRTHVCFYSMKTFEWIRDRFGFSSLRGEGDGLVCLTRSIKS